MKQFPEIIGLFGNEYSPAKLITPNGDILGYKLAGSGTKKVVFLHDWSVSCDGDYSFVSNFLDGTRMEIAFADLRGYGASKSMDGEFNAEEASQDIRKLADSLLWDEFSIVGHSMTGLVVQKVMADIPSRIHKVVAATPVPARGMNSDEATIAFFESVPENDDAFKSAMTKLTNGSYDQTWLNNKLMMNRASVKPLAMKAYVSMFAKSDYSSQVKGIETPILVIYGTNDSENFQATATEKFFRSCYPNLSTKLLSTGHYPMLEAPVAYATTIQSYLLS